MAGNIDKRMEEGIKLAKLGFYSYLFDGTILSADKETFDFFELEGIYKDHISLEGRNIETLFEYTGPKGRLREELKSKKSVSRFEYGIKTLKGNEKWGMHNSYLFIDDETGKEAVQVCFYDITERIRQEEEKIILKERLVQSEKLQALGQLAGGIAHDFNNQLTGIIGFADLLRYELHSDIRLSHYVDNILISARHSAGLTNQLLAFARKGKYLSVEIDVHRTIMEVISILRHSIDKRIELQQIFRANPPVIKGDPTQIQNAILNLALNARDAMPSGGTLTFETSVNNSEKGKYIEIIVSDTGTGMTEDVRKKIFEPFFTTKEVGRGTGMGLPAVYGTVTNHKGSIEVNSVPGKGTSVKLLLPQSNCCSKAESETNENRAVFERKLKLLIIDDEEIVCRIGKEMLEMNGHKVITCLNSREAVEQFRKDWNEIELVILDMVMPNLNGTDTFKALKEINPDVNVLLSSGYSISGEAQKLIEDGAKGFIQKPFTQEELKKSISDIFDFKSY